VQHEDDGPTYVYHAAIRNADGVVLGGIGLVFHAQREFKAMLEGVTGVQAGGAGSRQVAYLNRSGLVMSSSDVQLQPGMQLDLPPQMLALAPGQSMARAMVYQGQYCVVAITAGSGYREFKRSDGYREEVLALSVQAFGAVQDDALAAVSRRNTRVQSLAAASQGSAAGMEMATFLWGAACSPWMRPACSRPRVPRPSLPFRPDACRIAWARWRGAARVWPAMYGSSIWGRCSLASP
jgi:hypothetical protein